VVAIDLRQAIAQDDLRAQARQGRLQRLGHFRIHLDHDLLGHLHQADAQPPPQQLLGAL